MTQKIHASHDIHHGFSPVLTVIDGSAALAFYTKAFDAKEDYRLTMPDGSVGHAQFTIGDTRFMLSDEFPKWNALGPITLGGSPVKLHMYVKDVDAFCAKAVAAGLKVIEPISDQFYGDRAGRFEDPFGHIWMFATHTKDVTVVEMQKFCDSMDVTKS